MYRWMMMVAATVCCLALSARDGDAGRNGMALPGYDVPTLALDVPQLRLDAAGWRNAVDAPGYDRAVRIDPSAAYAVSDRIALWDGGGLAGYGSVTSYPGLMGVERGGFAVVQQFGPVTLTLDAGVARYGMFHESVTRLSAGGSAVWQISDKVSLTVFGSYYNSNFFYSAATMPYMGASNYGAFLKVDFNDHVGMAMGVKREYDSSTGRWITVPIAAPYVNAWGQTVSVDFGGLIREVLVDHFWADDRCPVMAPPRHVTPVAPRR